MNYRFTRFKANLMENKFWFWVEKEIEFVYQAKTKREIEAAI